MAMTVKLDGMRALKKELRALEKTPKAVMNRTLNDIKKRAQPWIAAEVARTYNVKKSDITGQKIGNVRVTGDCIQELQIVYTGRMLTPAHFGMTPTAPKEGTYTLKAAIVRGQKKTLGKVKKLTKKQRAALSKNFRREGKRSSNSSPIMLMSTGAKSQDKTQYIPFQRRSKDRTDIKAIKTISLPQMVSSQRASPKIEQALQDGLEKRLHHYIERYFGKE